MAHDVFISYATEDKPTTDAACAALEARGIRCWIAPRDVLPGMDYAHAVVKAIDESGVMVLVFSSRSSCSPQVRTEVELPVSSGIPILPFRIENVPPSPPLEKHLRDLAETVRLHLQAVGSPDR